MAGYWLEDTLNSVAKQVFSSEADPSLDQSGQKLNKAGGGPGLDGQAERPGPPEALPVSEDLREISETGRSFSSWSRKQKRCYHRVRSILTYWLTHGFQVLWVCLTSSPQSDATKLAYHHTLLRKLIEQKFGFKGMEHFQVKTREGHGVLHVFWAWRAPRGFRNRSFYIPQKWLSEAWERLHKAKVVWVCRLKKSKKAVRRVSAYAVSQYCADQAGFERMSWSWRRTFGFPLVSFWSWFKSMYRNFPFRVCILMWNSFLAGHTVMFCSGYYTNLKVARRFYEKRETERLHEAVASI